MPTAEEIFKWLDLEAEPWQVEMLQYFIDNPKQTFKLEAPRGKYNPWDAAKENWKRAGKGL